MASSAEYLEFILERLSDACDISYRSMMGEYVIYCRGKVIGGIYDDRFLVKPVSAAKELMHAARYEQPYPGAKDMILVDDPKDRAFMKKLAEGIADQLPGTKKKHK